MPKPRVLIEAGHYPDGGGAPGEAHWAYQLAHALAARLERSSVEVAVVGHWYGKRPPPQAAEHWSIFIALHYDAAIYGAGKNTGCCIARAAGDPVAAESDRFIALWRAAYPAATGIPLRQERVNPRMTDYYAFRDTTAKTPGVILEHGCGSPVPVGEYPAGDDSALLHDGIDLVADADAAAILEYLGLDVPAPPVPAPPASDEAADPVADPPAEPLAEAVDWPAQVDHLHGVIATLTEQLEHARGEWGRIESELGAVRVHELAPARAAVEQLKAQLAAANAVNGAGLTGLQLVLVRGDGSTETREIALS